MKYESLIQALYHIIHHIIVGADLIFLICIKELFAQLALCARQLPLFSLLRQF